MHRALTEPILLGGAPRAVAIAQRHARRRHRPGPAPVDRRPAASGSSAIWPPCGRAKRDPPFVDVVRRHLRIPRISACEALAMMNLAEYRKKPTSLADFLPWAALVAPGIVLNKDGCSSARRASAAPISIRATAAELVAITARLNNALRRLGSGWAIFFEAQRDARQPLSAEPVSRSGLVPRRRRAPGAIRGGRRAFREPLLPDLPLSAAARRRRARRALALRGPIAQDRRRCRANSSMASSTAPTACLQLVEGFMPEAAWLDDAETLTYLHSTHLDQASSRARARDPDASRRASWPTSRSPAGSSRGSATRICACSPFIGFPIATLPGLLDALNRLAFPYRWSTRAICLDKTEATRLLTKIRRQWFAKRKSIMAILKEVMTNEASALLDPDAAQQGARMPMRRCRSSAPTRVGQAYVTATVTVWDADPRNRRREAAAGREDHPGPRLHLHARDASTRSKPGSAACPAMSMPMSASRRSRPSTSPT